MTALEGLQGAAVVLMEVGLWALIAGAFDRLAPRAWVHARYSLALAGLWLLPVALGLSLRPAPGPLFAPEVNPVVESVASVELPFGEATRAVRASLEATQTALPREVGSFGPLLLLLVWGCVSLLLSLRLAGDLFRLHAVWRRLSPEALPIELSLPISVHRSSDVHAPVFIGYGYRSIAVPISFVIDDDARLVLEHEVAHAERRDDAVELINRSILALFWWALPVYVLDGVVRRSREILCDRRAAEVTGSPRQLAQALVRAAEGCIQPPDSP